MTNEYSPEITGKVTVSLQTYEKWKSYSERMKKERNIEAARSEDILKAARHLSEFLHHVSGKIEGFQDLVDAFNENSDACEIQKDSDGRYKIKVI